MPLMEIELNAEENWKTKVFFFEISADQSNYKIVENSIRRNKKF